MTTTTTGDAIVADIVRRIEHGLEEWRSGRMTSPDDRDHVLDAIAAIEGARPGFVRPSDERIEQLANTLFEDAGETWVTVEQVAKYLYGELTA